MRMRNDIKRFEVSGGTTTLTPALSPRRGRIVRRLMEKQAAGFAGRSIAKPEMHYGCPLSSGERARVRASVKTNSVLLN
jgi:hypothetical protein